MKKILIPSLLVVTLITAGAFAFMPVDRAETTHLPTISAGIPTSAVTSATINDDAILNIDINAGADIAFTKLAPLTDAFILVGDGANDAVAVNPAGDVEISNTGATTITAGAVNGAELADAIVLDAPTSITGNTLTIESAGGDSGIAFKGILSGTTADAGVAGNVVVTVTGAATGDLAFCSIRDTDDIDRTATVDAITANTVTVALSGTNTGANTFIDCLVFDIT